MVGIICESIMSILHLASYSLHGLVLLRRRLLLRQVRHPLLLLYSLLIVQQLLPHRAFGYLLLDHRLEHLGSTQGLCRLWWLRLFQWNSITFACHLAVDITITVHV